MPDTPKEDMQHQNAYDELKAAKEEDITAGQEQIDSTTTRQMEMEACSKALAVLSSHSNR